MQKQAQITVCKYVCASEPHSFWKKTRLIDKLEEMTNPAR